MAVYENTKFKCEAEYEERDSNYEVIRQREGNTEQDKVYTQTVG